MSAEKTAFEQTEEVTNFLDELIGASAALHKVRQQIELVARRT